MQDETLQPRPEAVDASDAWGLKGAAHDPSGLDHDQEWARYEILGDHDDARDPEALGAALAGILVLLLIAAAVASALYIW